jgi:hypothetical protein
MNLAGIGANKAEKHRRTVVLPAPLGTEKTEHSSRGARECCAVNGMFAAEVFIER